MMNKFLWLAVVLGLCASTVQAQVRVVKGGAAKAGIDWSRLVAGGGVPAEFKRVLEDDLIHSGWFVPAAPGAEFSLVGVAQDSGQLAVQIQLYSASQQRWLLSKQYTAASAAIPNGRLTKNTHRSALCQ